MIRVTIIEHGESASTEFYTQRGANQFVSALSQVIAADGSSARVVVEETTPALAKYPSEEEVIAEAEEE